MDYIFPLLVFIALIVIILGFTNDRENQTPGDFEAPEKLAGRQGEYVATNIIKSVLREDDYLFTNISVSYDGKPTELDNVVVNKYGVFIIEINRRVRIQSNDLR